jgi:hypothetical protein
MSKEVGRSGEKKIPCAPLFVHRPFDGEQEGWRTLHFIQGQRAAAEQRFGTALGLIQHPDLIQSEVGARGAIRPYEGGFPRLAGAREHRYGQHPESRLQVPQNPALAKSVHSVK